MKSDEDGIHEILRRKDYDSLSEMVAEDTEDTLRHLLRQVKEGNEPVR